MEKKFMVGSVEIDGKYLTSLEEHIAFLQHKEFKLRSKPQHEQFKESFKIDLKFLQDLIELNNFVYKQLHTGYKRVHLTGIY